MNINEIATRATRIKKPTRAEAFNIIRAMADPSIENSEDRTAKNLTSLYAFFIPKIGKPKTEEQWVSKAMGKGDVRRYLNYCYSDGTRYIATDGHRVHYMPTDKPEGFYDASGTAVDIKLGKFPLIDSIIPRGESVDMPDYGVVDTGTKFSAQVADIPFEYLGEKDTVRVNYRYLKEALSLSTDVKMFVKTDIDSVRLDFGNDCHAVIMSIRK